MHTPLEPDTQALPGAPPPPDAPPEPSGELAVDPSAVAEPASYSRRVLTSFLWQGGGTFLGQAVSWVATLVVIRLLSPNDYGLMAMANVFFGFFLLISGLGFGSATVQAAELTREQFRTMFGIILTVNLVGAALAVLAAPLIAGFFSEPRLVPILQVLAINFLLVALYILPQSNLLRDMDFGTKAKVDVFATVCSAAMTLVLALMGVGVWSLVLGVLTLHAVKAVLFNVVRRVPLLPSFAFRSVTGLARFGALSTVSILLFFLYGQADVVIGGRFLGADELGLYAVALSLASIPMEKVIPVITQVSFAAFSRIQHDRARVNRNVLRAVRLVSLACFPAFLGLAAVAPDFVPLVLGNRWVDLVVPFQILCLVLPLKALSSLFAPPLLGVGRPGVEVVNMVIALTLMSAALLVGVRYGVVGLTLAWLVAYPFVFLIIAFRSLRVLQIPATQFFRTLAFPAFASLTMLGAVVGVGVLMGDRLPEFPRLIVMVGTGALVYAGLLYGLNRQSIMELYSTLRN